MSNTFKLIIGLENDAFEGEGRAAEIARLLRYAADGVEAGVDGLQRLLDANGNRVGYATFTDEAPEPEGTALCPVTGIGHLATSPDDEGIVVCVDCGTRIQLEAT